MYGFVVAAWLIYVTGNVDQQPVAIPFASMEACQKAADDMKGKYRYPSLCEAVK